MRPDVDAARVRALAQDLGRHATERVRLYVTSGATAVLFGFDPYSQALAKLARGLVQDLADVAARRERRLVDDARLLELFDAIEDALFRYPRIDPAAFRARVEAFVAS